MLVCRPKWVQNIPSLQRLHTATDLLSAVADHNIQINDDNDYGDGGWSIYYSLDHITQTFGLHFLFSNVNFIFNICSILV